MNKILTLAFVAPLALAAGCGSDAKSCTISTTPGGQTLVCPDGTSSTIGAGTTGATGVSSLATVTDEPAGANCAYGGKAIATGVDTNGDGTLQPSEVKSTSYVGNPSAPPSPTITGDVTVTNSLDLAKLAGVTSVSGALVIEAEGFTSISLPSLQHAGSFVIEADDALTTVSAPALATVDTTFVLNGSGIATVDFGALTSTNAAPGEGNSQFVVDNTAITDFTTFSKLTTPGDTIEIEQNAKLTSLAGLEAALASATIEVDIDDNVLLTNVAALAGLKTIRRLEFDGNLAAPALTLTALTEVTSELDIEGNDALVSVSAPALTAFNYLDVANNPLLTTLSFPLLGDSTNYQFYASNNPVLTMCTFGTVMSCAVANND